MGSLMFICPFWGQKGHVGTFRAERFVRWLNESGQHVYMVTASHEDSISEEWFGTLISVRDPLKIYPIAGSTTIGNDKRRNPNALRRWIAYFLLIPDLHRVWARKVLKSSKVDEYAKNCDTFVASSPPESAFLAASKLAQRYAGKFIMDMRDGWLDEPMKPLLRELWIQRLRESRLEKKFLKSSTFITVTSTHWKKLLETRYPLFASKIKVIPNTYPVTSMESIKAPLQKENERVENLYYTLVHAGRLSSSRPERNIELLLNYVDYLIDIHNIRIKLIFLGNLDKAELQHLEGWKERISKKGSQLDHIEQVSRSEAIELIAQADGLLMVSNSYASIPAKYFDYSVSGKPILCLTSNGSILQDIAKVQKQIHVVIDEETPNNELEMRRFFNSLIELESDSRSSLLPEFSEEIVRSNFMNLVAESGHG